MKRTSLDNEVRLLGQSLQIGQSVRTQCPVCGDSERSFSVTRNGHGLLYNCYRATCPGVGYGPARGFVSTIPVAGEPYNPNKLAYCQRQAQPYTGELHALLDRDLRYFKERFDLLEIPIFSIMRSSMDDDQAQYVLSLQDHRGYTRGHAIRRGGWKGEPATPGRVDNVKPKTKTFMLRPDYLAQHVARPEFGERHKVVIVEDYVSSLKVAQAGYTGVALMGTNMNADRAHEIRQLAPRAVVIALDADATANAMRMARDWGLSWEKTSVLMLQTDIKDMSHEAVQELLK